MSLFNNLASNGAAPFDSILKLINKEQKKPVPKISFTWGVGEDLIVFKKSTKVPDIIIHPSNQHFKEV